MKVKVGKKDLFVLIGLLVMVGVDILTKFIFESVFGLHKTVVAIPYLFNIFCIRNDGASGNIFAGQTWFLISITIVFIILFIIYYLMNKNKNPLFYASAAFIMAGALGNLIDRMFLGEVRDFIQFAFWTQFPVFNFADTFITVGVILFMIYILFPNLYKKKPKDFVINIEKTDENNKVG